MKSLQLIKTEFIFCFADSMELKKIKIKQKHKVKVRSNPSNSINITLKRFAVIRLGQQNKFPLLIYYELLPTQLHTMEM